MLTLPVWDVGGGGLGTAQLARRRETWDVLEQLVTHWGGRHRKQGSQPSPFYFKSVLHSEGGKGHASLSAPRNRPRPPPPRHCPTRVLKQSPYSSHPRSLIVCPVQPPSPQTQGGCAADVQGLTEDSLTPHLGSEHVAFLHLVCRMYIQASVSLAVTPHMGRHLWLLLTSTGSHIFLLCLPQLPLPDMHIPSRCLSATPERV